MTRENVTFSLENRRLEIHNHWLKTWYLGRRTAEMQYDDERVDLFINGRVIGGLDVLLTMLAGGGSRAPASVP